MEHTNESAWQANMLVFLRLYREKLLLASNQKGGINEKPPMEVTREALFTIVLVAVIIILGLLGSLSSTFEFFYEEKSERRRLSGNNDYKHFTDFLSMKDQIIKCKSFLRCFCVVKNWRKLFETDVTDKFNCFHGIRVISNLSIIWIHVFIYNILTRSANELKPALQNPISKLILNGDFAVDTFFVLSGFFNAYAFCKSFHKNKENISWRNFYLKRYFRLTPVNMIMFGFHAFLLNYTGSGPIWPEYANNPICKKNWWKYLFYLNNFESTEKSCMPWCWHIAADMQLYIVSPIFLLLLLRWNAFGYILTFITMFLSSLYSFKITRQFNLIHCNYAQLGIYIDDLETFNDRFWIYMDKLHFNSFSRISPYLIGVLLGFHLSNKKFQDSNLKWITLCFGWIASGFLIWISFFWILKKEVSVLEAAIYNSLRHTFFSIGLSWIIWVCLTEQTSFVNGFLSWKIFIPFSKLSYCSYLIHIIIMKRDYQAAEDLGKVSFLSMVLYLFRVCFWTYAFSIPVSLLFEMPVMNLLERLKKEEIKRRKEK